MLLGLVTSLLAAAGGQGAQSIGNVRLLPNQQSPSGVVLKVCPANDCGHPVVDLCNYALTMGIFQGNWDCLDGLTGTQMFSDAGVTAFNAVGTPVAQTQSICGNGSNCGAERAWRVSSGNNFASDAGVLAPTGDFSACWLGSIDVVTGTQVMVAEDDVSTHRAFTLYGSTSSPVFDLFSGNTTFTEITGGAGKLLAGDQHLVCATYHFVADGSSAMALYVDGVSVSTSAIAHGPVNPVTYPVTVGSQATGASNPLAGLTYAALKTDLQLSTTQVQQLTAEALGARYGGVQGSLGEATSFARGSGATCQAPDGTITQLASGQQCFTQGGVKVRPAVTNLAQQSASVGATAPWGCAGCTTAAAAQNALDGSATGKKLIWSAGAGSGAVQTFTTSASGTYTCSVWAAADGATALQIYMLDTTTSTVVTGSTTNATLTGAWTRYTSTGTPTATHAVEFVVGNSLSTNTLSFDAWGAQCETGSVASDYCPTGAASATCAAESAVMAAATPGLTGAFCWSGDFNASFAANTGLIQVGAQTANTWDMYTSSGGGLLAWVVYDNTDAVAQWTTTGAPATAGLHHIRLCQPNDGNAPLLWVDGAAQGIGAKAGAGTSILSSNATAIQIGSGMNGQLRGTVSNLCVGNCSAGAVSSCSVCP